MVHVVRKWKCSVIKLAKEGVPIRKRKNTPLRKKFFVALDE
jgi:hypothetical protein